MKLNAFIIVVILSFTSFNTSANERSSGDLEILLGSFSFHADPAPKGHSWNNTNPSLGIKGCFASESGFELFGTLNAVASNQTGGQTYEGGFGAQYRLFQKYDFNIIIGGVIGGQSYANEWDKTRKATPLGYPFVGFSFRKFTLEGSYRPEIDYNGTIIPAYATVNMGLRFR